MGFFNKLRKKVQNKIVSPELAPFNRGRSVLTGLRNTDRRNIGSGIIFNRMPQKPQKFTGLSGLFRRLQEQVKNQQIPQPMPVPGGPLTTRIRIENMLENRLKNLPVPELRAGEIMPNSPVLDRRPTPPRMPAPPIAVPPGMIPNLDLGMPVMPEERMAPPVMNQMQGEPRMMMSVGGPSVVGRALSQRFKNPSKAVLGVRGRNLPDRMMPGIGDRILGSPGRGQPGGLFYGPQQLNRIRNTENAIMAGGGLGVATLADGTQMFREPFSEENIGIMSPEAFGRDLAQLRMDVGSVVNLAKNKANEIGANINEYVGRARSAYDQEMENQRMQELDAEQGMQPFSMLMGPDMPLFRPEPQQRQQQESLDDILADLEKKN